MIVVQEQQVVRKMHPVIVSLASILTIRSPFARFFAEAASRFDNKRSEPVRASFDDTFRYDLAGDLIARAVY